MGTSASPILSLQKFIEYFFIPNAHNLYILQRSS